MLLPLLLLSPFFTLTVSRGNREKTRAANILSKKEQCIDHKVQERGREREGERVSLSRDTFSNKFPLWINLFSSISSSSLSLSWLSFVLSLPLSLSLFSFVFLSQYSASKQVCTLSYAKRESFSSFHLSSSLSLSLSVPFFFPSLSLFNFPPYIHDFSALFKLRIRSFFHFFVRFALFPSISLSIHASTTKKSNLRISCWAKKKAR